MALSIGLSRAPRTGLAVAWVWVDELGFFVCLFVFSKKQSHSSSSLGEWEIMQGNFSESLSICDYYQLSVFWKNECHL